MQQQLDAQQQQRQQRQTALQLLSVQVVSSGTCILMYVSHYILFIILLDISKEICPKDVCKLKKKGRNFVQCNTCEQWYHCSCVGLTKRKAEELQEFKCKECK
jgi:hypothetical protein